MPVFLYTDIEGSTQLWEKHGSVMSAVLDRHDEILVDCIEGCRGRFVKHSGDGILAVFEGSDALPLECALAMQRRLAAEPWPGIDELRVRVALHAGAAQYRAGDYFGSVINRVARLLATAWGGQIVVTPAVLARATVPEDASLTDLGVHLLKDLSEPQQVFGLLHPDLPLREFPALRSMSSRPNNLPQQPTPLVGRKEELAEIAELLARPECRLLTLVAPGGMGKTRLGLQAAAEQIDCFRHGVFFVPLAGVTSADNLPATIANALKFAFYDSADLETQLHSYLSEKQILLLLDNFEHLMAGVETVAGILSAAPQVKILATSRQRLHLQGEWTYDVSGLPVPQHGRGLEAEAYAAVELFLQAAQRLKPSFDPGRDELQAIVRVCRLVDGMPLALELAAAWIDTLSCQEIAAEIEQDLDLLTTEMRDVPARQRSVRAVFEHAWHRLGPEEQAAFARLSVFRGGFTRTAARKVSGAGIRTVATLIDEALMARDSSGRFQMHELLRQFAAEKLAEDKEAERSTRADHAAYFADWLQTLEAPLLRGQRSEPIKQIDQELDNVLLAGRWALDRADADLLEAGLNSLFWFYEAKAWYADGLEAYSAAERAVAHRLATEQRRAAEDETLTTRLARLHLQLRIRKAWFATRLSRYDDDYLELPAESDTLLAEGDYASHWVAYGLAINTLYGRGRYAAARRLLEHYDEIAEAHMGPDWPWSKAQTLCNLGRISGALGEYESARELLIQGLDLLRPLGDQVGVMLYLHTLGGVTRILGHSAEARTLFQEGLALAETHGYAMGEVLALNDLGDLEFAEGRYEAAESRFEDSLARATEIGDRRGRALALTSLGRVATALGQYEQAIQLYRQGLTITERAGNRRGLALTLNRLSQAYRLLGDVERAVGLCERSLRICQELGYRKGETLARISCGEAALAHGDISAAADAFRAALAASEEVGFVSGIVRSLVGLGLSGLEAGEGPDAAAHLRRALDVATKSNLPRAQLHALGPLGQALVICGKPEEGVPLLALAARHPAAEAQTRQWASAALDDLAGHPKLAKLLGLDESMSLGEAAASQTTADDQPKGKG